MGGFGDTRWHSSKTSQRSGCHRKAKPESKGAGSLVCKSKAALEGRVIPRPFSLPYWCNDFHLNFVSSLLLESGRGLGIQSKTRLMELKQRETQLKTLGCEQSRCFEGNKTSSEWLKGEFTELWIKWSVLLLKGLPWSMLNTVVNFMHQHDWIIECPDICRTLFWECLEGGFWMKLTFESVDWIKQIVPPNLDGSHPVC